MLSELQPLLHITCAPASGWEGTDLCAVLPCVCVLLGPEALISGQIPSNSDISS